MNPAIQNNSNLIACEACGHPIATMADTCPYCHAPNNYVHPKVAAFCRRSWTDMPKFSYEHTRTTITMTAPHYERNRIGAMAIVGGILLSVLGQALNSVGLAIPGGFTSLAGILWLVLWHVMPRVAFVDFSTRPTRWRSNDQAFWQPVRVFCLQGERDPVSTSSDSCREEPVRQELPHDSPADDDPALALSRLGEEQSQSTSKRT